MNNPHLKNFRSKHNIVMIVFNGVYLDSRVIKEADSLTNSGYKVTVFGVDDGWKAPATPHIFNIELVKVKSRALRSKAMLPLKIIELIVRAHFRIATTKVDALHCHDIAPMIIAWPISKIKRIPLVYDSHELEYDRGIPNKWMNWLNRQYEALFIRRVDHIIVSEGDSRANVMIEKYQPLPPMSYVRNCPPLSPSKTTNNHSIKDILNLRNNVKIILYIGFIFPNRGIEELIEAMSITKNQQCVFVLMGGGIITNNMHQLINQHGLENRVHQIGPFPYQEVINYARESDIGVCLYKNTGLSDFLGTPTKLFDYINAGIPVIASNFPGVKSIFNEHQDLCTLTNPESPTEIALAIDHLLLISATTSRQIQNNMRRLHSEKYNWEIQELELVAIYDRFLSIGYSEKEISLNKNWID